LKNDVNVPSKSNEQKTFFLFVFCWRLEGKFSGSGSISQRHGSADPDLDPDPHQNDQESATLDVHIYILFWYGDKRTVTVVLPPVLRIRIFPFRILDAWSKRFLIPDPGFGSSSKNLSYFTFNPKTVSKFSEK
jgi:hypothetical protein